MRATRQWCTRKDTVALSASRLALGRGTVRAVQKVVHGQGSMRLNINQGASQNFKQGLLAESGDQGGYVDNVNRTKIPRITALDRNLVVRCH